MSFEGCFGGFAGSKSAPAAMGWKAVLRYDRANRKVAQVTVINEVANANAEGGPILIRPLTLG